MIEPSVVEERIRAGIENVEHIVLEDLTGTKDHYQATVVSQTFEGRTRVEQHQLVYRSLGELMAGPIHALALKTYTPGDWAKASKTKLTTQK
jgi:stress-induced morphogen